MQNMPRVAIVYIQAQEVVKTHGANMLFIKYLTLWPCLLIFITSVSRDANYQLLPTFHISNSCMAAGCFTR